jgi:hypothetical protein
MGDRGILIFAVIMGIAILTIALKFGEIGGGGAGASRTENPILFWMGVIITAVFTFVLASILVWTFVR